MRDSLLRREVPVATNHRLIARKSVRRRSGSGSSALQETARASATTTLKKSKEPSFKEFHFTPTTMKLPLPVFRPSGREVDSTYEINEHTKGGDAQKAT